MNYIDPHLSFADFFKDKKIKPLAYHISKGLSDGHICLHIDKHNEKMLSLQSANKSDEILFPETIDMSELLQSEYLSEYSESDDNNTLFVMYKRRVYLQRYWVYETHILDKISEMIESTSRLDNVKKLQSIFGFIKKQFDTNSTETDWQLLSTINSCLNNFSIVTGGPGTGKTYTVAKILSILLEIQNSESIVMVAPTGKAAARMKESLDSAISTGLNIDDSLKNRLLSIESKTIHSLLGYRKGTHRFKHNRENRLKYSVVIADEASMIDASLMSKLLESVHDSARVILLGDKNQLASVEAGSVFGDLCRVCGEDIRDISPETLQMYKQIKETDLQVTTGNTILFSAVSELKESRRFDAKKGVGLFSSFVIEGKEEIIDDDLFYKENRDSIELFEEDSLLNEIIKKYEGYIKEKDIRKALKKFDDFRILCATKNGNFGVEQINSRVENLLNLNKGSDSFFYNNQPVMIRKNDKQLEIYNGDTGIVRKGDDGKLYFYMEGKEKISVALLPKCETAFAMTIHKSQGSDYREIAVLYPEEDSRILSKELLYTAVTRAKEKVYLFGKKEILKESIKRGVERASGILDRFS